MTEKKWKAKVGAHFIMKNEAENIPLLFESMKGCWDFAVVADTGSTDNSVELAKSYGAVVEHFEWIDDFGAARNYALEKLYEHFPEVQIVIWTDLDDQLLSKEDVIRFRELLDELLENPNLDCINCPYIYSHFQGEAGNQNIPEFRYYRLRAFKKGTARWKMRVHEFLESDASRHANPTDVTFHHFRKGTGVANTARNMRILKKVVEEATPEERPRYLFYYSKECTYNGLWEEAIKGFKEYVPLSNFPAERTRSFYELAVAHKVLNKIEEAKRWAFEAIIADQRYPDPYVLLCQIAYEQKDWRMCVNWAQIAPNLDRAETYFFDYIPMSTSMPNDFMQASYYALGDLKKGAEALDKCLFYKSHERRYLNNWKYFHPDHGKVGIVIPTLNRPKQLQNCIAKIKENIFLDNYEIFIGVDGNEEYFKELNEIYKDEKQMNIILFEEKSTVPEIVENLIDLAEKSGCTYCSFLGDDTEPLVGFMVHAIRSCEDKYLIAYNDKVTTNECQHWFAPIKLRKQLGGYFFHKGYIHLGCDNDLLCRASNKGLYKFCPDAFIDHVHYIKNICSDKNKVAEFDDCYKLAWCDETVDHDRALLEIRKKNNFIADTENVKINIGAGNVNYPDYLSLDKYVKSDIQKDIFEEGLFKPETVNRFISEHFLEHLSSENGEKFLKICYAALKSNGELELVVPDIGCIDMIKSESYKLKVLYGWRTCGEGMYHLFGYNEKSLIEVLQKTGFQIITINKEWTYDAPSLRVVVKK